MRRTYLFIALLAIALIGVPGARLATATGNGAPSGSHYNLNIIGVPKDKTADMNNNNGGRIFVQLVGGEDAASLNGKTFSTMSKVNKIFLTPGDSFNVLDANATDANGAMLQLPLNVSTDWTVWVRALGKPGGTADMTTCATTAGLDGVLGTADDEVLCSMATLHVDRTKNAKFTNESSKLLFVTVNVVLGSTLSTCLGGATGTVTLPLFNTCLQNYFWNYQNNGLKLLQLRFYPALPQTTS